jgi:L-glutamine-phosphate cytidylyltransferase
MTSSAPAKVIIVAAGRGRRLGNHTDEIPKCMVEVAGKPILHRQLDALAAAGVADVTVVRGYRGHVIDGGKHRLRFVENPEWERNNILASLMYAREEMERGDGFFFSYADIVYAPLVAARLAEAARRAGSDAALVVDRLWHEAYVGRTLHPIPEAELTAVRGDGAAATITRVGKQAVPVAEAAGEFIGLAWFSARAGRALAAIWDEALRAGGLEAPFGRAAALRNAYVSDGLNALVEAGHRLTPVFIEGQWREIDTGQDLAAAEASVDKWA